MLKKAFSMDERTFRDTLGHYPSGITIVATHDGDRPVGFTCQSFYSISMEPPLISFGVMKTSTSYPAIREQGLFSVNVLSADQSAVSNQFARSGTDKWQKIEWDVSRAGNPLIRGSLMWLDCSIHAEYEVGDHFMVVGRVNDASETAGENAAPLLYYRGRYRQLGDHIV